jgi:transcriptional regulator with XRE-family HTH domain
MKKNDLSMEEFAARLRGARAFADLTLAEMGDLLGISPQGLSKRENCKQDTTDAERFYYAVVICEKAGLPMTWFTEPDRSKLSTQESDGDALSGGVNPPDLTPAEVIELVESRGRGDDEDGAALP